MLERVIESETAMAAFGEDLGRRPTRAGVIFLNGDLGAGKTTLARGLLHGLGYQGLVTSPTFTLLETYPVAGLTVVHIDLYRLEDPAELEQLAIRDYLDGRSVLLVEWAERARASLPAPDCEVHISMEEGQRRTLRMESFTAEGERLCRA